jgi:hypothetical protein
MFKRDRDFYREVANLSDHQLALRIQREALDFYAHDEGSSEPLSLVRLREAAVLRLLAK